MNIKFLGSDIDRHVPIFPSHPRLDQTGQGSPRDRARMGARRQARAALGETMIPALREIPGFLTYGYFPFRNFWLTTAWRIVKLLCQPKCLCLGQPRRGCTMNLMNRKLRQHLQDAPRGTLNALADHLGVPYQTIQKWLSGERPLSEKDYKRCMVFLTGYRPAPADRYAILDHLHQA
jgi:hypothetical protein